MDGNALCQKGKGVLGLEYETCMHTQQDAQQQQRVTTTSEVALANATMMILRERREYLDHKHSLPALPHAPHRSLHVSTT